MELLYIKDGKIYCNDYIEIYIPIEYFESNMAMNQGSSVETFGVVYVRGFKNGTPGKFQYLNAPVIINLMIYEYKNEVIEIKNKSIDVMTLQYIKDSYVMRQSIVKGREVAEFFLATELNGKLPFTLNYADDIMDLWWRNLEMAGVNYKVPSKIYEMIVATTYRDPNNRKRRYGQLYGSQTNPTGFDYTKSNVRSVVKDLSTFSGMVFEDIGMMISNGINNSLTNFDEPESPLEKIIHY